MKYCKFCSKLLIIRKNECKTDWGKRIHCGKSCANRSRSKLYWKDKNGYLNITIYGINFKIHQLLAEYYFKKKLKKNQVIHHKNGIITDNRKSNLEIMSKSEHQRLHAKNIPRDKDGHFTKYGSGYR